MPPINPAIINQIFVRNDYFYVPPNIISSIEQCLSCNDEDAITKEYQRLLEEFQRHETSKLPATIDYSNSLTLDAYTCYYLPRYLFIPLIALKDLSFHDAFQNIPDSFNVLDLGTGTGAVVLGLLSLFSSKRFASVTLNITAVDSCHNAIERQKELINRAGFNIKQVKYLEQDISDIQTLTTQTEKSAPFDIIFSANCLTELGTDIAEKLLKRLSKQLTDYGVIVIAESQRDYVKTMIHTLASVVGALGLHIYYPCPSTGCYYSAPKYCWAWRNHRYKVPSIKVNGRFLQGDRKDEYPISWLFLAKNKISIYDMFNKKYGNLIWGPISNESGRKICYGGKLIPFNMDLKVSRVYKRGCIVGLTTGHKIQIYHTM
ncbi:MAG: class I SAM-dependent methyltransferase [Dehalococcoidia bacterium]|jgi:SAM-dependent methyltransferase